MSDPKSGTQSEKLVFPTVLSIGIVMLFVGCSSMERSVSLGIASGAVSGVGAGLIAGGRDRTNAALISAGVGAVIGGIASYVIHGQLDNRDTKVRRDTLFNLENHGITKSSSGNVNLSDVGDLLNLPDVEEDWIDTHAEGSKLIEGHRVWSINGGATWDLSKKPAKKKRK